MICNHVTTCNQRNMYIYKKIIRGVGIPKKKYTRVRKPFKKWLLVTIRLFTDFLAKKSGYKSGYKVVTRVVT